MKFGAEAWGETVFLVLDFLGGEMLKETRSADEAGGSDKAGGSQHVEFSLKSVLSFVVGVLCLVCPVAGTLAWAFYFGWPAWPTFAAVWVNRLYYALLLLYMGIALGVRLRYPTRYTLPITTCAFIGVAGSLAMLAAYSLLWLVAALGDVH
jgi:hypothetical protein